MHIEEASDEFWGAYWQSADNGRYASVDDFSVYCMGGEL